MTRRVVKNLSCLLIAGLILLTGTNLFAQRRLAGRNLKIHARHMQTRLSSMQRSGKHGSAVKSWITTLN
jgi:hypothetical protein